MTIEISADRRAAFLKKRISDFECLLTSDLVDVSRIATILHQLQGSVGTFGFKELEAYVSKVQNDLRSISTIEDVRTCLKPLMAQFGVSLGTVKGSVFL